MVGFIVGFLVGALAGSVTTYFVIRNNRKALDPQIKL